MNKIVLNSKDFSCKKDFHNARRDIVNLGTHKIEHQRNGCCVFVPNYYDDDEAVIYVGKANGEISLTWMSKQDYYGDDIGTATISSDKKTITVRLNSPF